MEKFLITVETEARNPLISFRPVLRLKSKTPKTKNKLQKDYLR